MNNFNIFNCIKSLYHKKLENIEIKEIEMYQNIAISKWLIYEESNLNILEKVIKYIFYLEPINYFYLLALNLPKLERVPFLHKIEKETIEKNKLFDKIKFTLQWSDKELKLHTKLLEKIIDEVYWGKELGCQKQ